MSGMVSIKRGLMIFAVALSIAIGIVFIAVDYWNHSNAELQASNKAVRAAKKEYEHAVNNRRIFEEFNPRFELINRHNIVNSENRLDWAEKIEAITNRYNLPQVEYRIEKQEALKDAALKKQFPGIKISKSVMKLDMQVMHEGDVFRLLNSLDEEAKGLFDVQKCTIERKKQAGTDLLTQFDFRNFSVSCVLNWYSIKGDGV